MLPQKAAVKGASVSFHQTIVINDSTGNEKAGHVKHNSKRFKIAVITALDAQQKRIWSGTYYYMAKALQKHCGYLYYLGPVKSKLETSIKVYNKLVQFLLNKRYSYRHSILLAKQYAQIFNRRIAQKSFDLIYAPAAAVEIAFLNTKIPIIYSSDTTFALLNGYYPEYTNLLQTSIQQGNTIERLAIQQARLMLYPTEWAARSACSDYHADKEKICILPYGANLEEVPVREAILQKKRKSKSCRLFFLGVNWQRKGGDIAFETLLKLEELGIPAELIVCGCVPPKEFSHRRMEVIPFLDKSDEKQRKELNRLFLLSDFFLLPTRNECYGIVFCEANAFGLPVITTDTGGVSGIVKEGENGFLLPTSARGIEYARVIEKLFHNVDYYSKLFRKSRDAYDTRLNWDAWGRGVKKVLEKRFS